MQTAVKQGEAVKQAESAAFIRGLRFPAEMERAFQESYYTRKQVAIRVSTFLLMLGSVSAAFISTGILAETPGGEARISDTFTLTHPETLWFSIASVLYLFLIGASFRQGFVSHWQTLVGVATLFYLSGLTVTRSADLSLQTTVCVILIWGRFQRLQFRWMAFLLLGIFVCAVLRALTDIDITAMREAVQAEGAAQAEAIFAFFFGGLLVLLAIPLIWTLRSERNERNEFFARYLLAQERNEERLKREQTEKMLHILSQAIGGIVHDLGNPLTTVQSGAQTLLDFVKDGEADRELVQEFAEMITDGAQMLNYLRLSLMEQTRVLEGKPVPVNREPASVAEMVKAGARYQKPKFASGRQVLCEGDDLQVCVDEMRFITVFMNLIGNALKYSDGPVRITWRPQGKHVLIAVQDQGQNGVGISQTQAEKLFVPFGRLDTHAQIEGTGLGLLSVRKIAEAHDGEVYIEGCSNDQVYGQVNSRVGDTVNAASPLASSSVPPIFSTAQGHYPALLDEGFRTAFVVACPLEILPPHGENAATGAA